MFRGDVEHGRGPPRRRRPRVQHDVHRLAEGLDRTPTALRGSGPPLRLALVPVMGRPSPSASALGTGWSGSLHSHLPSAGRHQRRHGFGYGENQRQAARPECLR